MAVFRIEKTRDYTVMSNHHLRDMSLSLKAKGLLSLMLSLPENWDYTMKGLARICKDGIDSISGGIRELEEHGYLIRERVRGANGQLGSIEYTILEQPKEPTPAQEKPIRENPVQVNPTLVTPVQEEPAQLNKEESSNYPSRTDLSSTELSNPIQSNPPICLYTQDWQTRSYLALGGVSGKALDRFLSERKDTRKVFLCLDSDTAGSEACTRLAQSIPGEIAVIRLVPARKDWNDVLRQQGDIPSRKFIAETITLRELPTAQPVPMLRMADVELTSVDWLWFPYIPFGKLTIIQGNPGEGKTYFAMRLAAACTNRKPLPGMETLEPFNIIYQTAEDGLGDTVKPRLMEADADLERVLVIDDRDTPLTLADERIARAIRENNARLVIIDPVQAFLGADVDMNRANEVRPIFRSLGDIAQATGCAIVLIGHLNKAAGTQSTYRGLGSIDITAAVRSLLFIGKLKDSPTTRVLIHEKSSLAPPGQSLAFSLGDEKGFEWIGAYDITADELLAGTDTAKTESKTAQAQMLILELLADGKRMPSAELEKAVNERGISSRTMRTAKSRIGDRLVTEKDGTAWVCYLRD